jgi:hypothetical protein
VFEELDQAKLVRFETLLKGGIKMMEEVLTAYENPTKSKEIG